MAPRNDCIIATRWRNENGRNDPEVLELIRNLPNSITVQDITGQDDRIIPPRPNIYLVEVLGLTNAQLTAAKADNRFIVLMDRQYDDVTNVETASTYDNTPNGAQLLNFVDQLKTRFPNMDDDKLRRAGRDIFRPGMTRRQILAELIDRWKGLEKG